MTEALSTWGHIFLLTVLVTVFHANESQGVVESELKMNSSETRSLSIDDSTGTSSDISLGTDSRRKRSITSSLIRSSSSSSSSDITSSSSDITSSSSDVTSRSTGITSSGSDITSNSIDSMSEMNSRETRGWGSIWHRYKNKNRNDGKWNSSRRKGKKHHGDSSKSSDSSRSRYSSSESQSEGCENDADCTAQPALQCVNSRCQCLPGHVNVSGTCILLSCIGEPCNTTDECKGENVTCSEERGICLCSDGFMLSQDGKCVNRTSGSPLGGDCVMDSDCMGANQICVSNTCICQTGYQPDMSGVCQNLAMNMRRRETRGFVGIRGHNKEQKHEWW